MALRGSAVVPSRSSGRSSGRCQWSGCWTGGQGSGLWLVMLEGGGVLNWPLWGFGPPTHPHQKIFPQEKNEICQRGPNLDVDLTDTNLFLASDPPPPGCSISQPLSKGLDRNSTAVASRV